MDKQEERHGVTLYGQGEYWYARSNVSNKVKRKCIGNRSKIDKAHATAMAAAWSNTLDDNAEDPKTLGSLLVWYFKARSTDLSIASIRSLRRTGDLLNQQIGEDTLLSDLCTLSFVELRAFLLEQGYAENTVRKRTKEAKNMMEFGVQMGMLKRNPIYGRALPVASKKGNRRDRRIILDEEIYAVIEQLKCPRWKMAVALAAWTGMRRHEVFKTEAIALDMNRRGLEVWSDKTSTERVTRIEPCLDIFLESVAQVRTTPLLCDLPRGYNMASAKLTSACTLAGIKPFTWQQLRQSRATTWRKQGWPASAINQWIGHSESTAVDHYVGDLGTGESNQAQNLQEENLKLRDIIVQITKHKNETADELSIVGGQEEAIPNGPYWTRVQSEVTRMLAEAGIEDFTQQATAHVRSQQNTLGHVGPRGEHPSLGT